MNDEEYWELLEEQHAHDVVMLPTQTEINNDQDGGDDECISCTISALS